MRHSTDPAMAPARASVGRLVTALLVMASMVAVASCTGSGAGEGAKGKVVQAATSKIPVTGSG